MDNLFLL